jgi:hypothetical protein
MRNGLENILRRESRGVEFWSRREGAAERKGGNSYVEKEGGWTCSLFIIVIKCCIGLPSDLEGLEFTTAIPAPCMSQLGLCTTKLEVGVSFMFQQVR